MRALNENVQAQASALRKQAQPIWTAIENLAGYERDQRAFESSVEHLEQQRLCITVMGEFNTGKSTLLNTFIGEELLATDQLECTAVPTWVRWADDESDSEYRRVTVVYESGDTKPMPFASPSEISAHTTLDQDSWETIERVEIILPQPDEKERRTGIVLVDTPGLNGREDLQARSIHQLGMSHVTIVVVPVDGVGRESDVTLIKKALSIADRVMVVINKCDQHAKTGDGFDKFRDELLRRIPDLRYEDIYTLSAKRAFEGNTYKEGEEELEHQFENFRDDLINAFKNPTEALQKRPLSLLREICKDEIARIDKLEAECDTGISKDLQIAEMRLESARANLRRSREEILRLARKTLMGEVNILQRFLIEEKSRIEREMMGFVDELEAELIEEDDIEVAREMMSERLNEYMQKSIFIRISRLLEASADRLIYDLENRVRVSALDLPGMASIKLDHASLKRQADKTSEKLSRREDEIDRLKREVARCERAVQKKKKKVETLRRQSAQLENLETQRQKAVKDRTQLGPKPAPKVEYYTGTKKVRRGGFFGSIADWWSGPKKVQVKKKRKNYSRVKKWEREYKAVDKKVSGLDKQIAPLRAKRAEIQKIEGELPKLQRETDKAQSNLRRAEARLEEEKDRYRQAGIKARQTLLRKGARTELESLFESLADRLKREAEKMLERITQDFSTRFNEDMARQLKLLEDEKARREAEDRAANAERVKREHIRKTLVGALDTFLSEN